MLKTKGYQVGLVTSSYRIKIERALKLMDIEEGFRYDCNGRSDNVRQTRSDVLFAGCRDLQVDPENVSFSRTPFPEYKRVRLPGCG
ncbi:MAG: hypothetical protein ACLUOS_07525 [Odoribacter splanchnicus]